MPPPSAKSLFKAIRAKTPPPPGAGLGMDLPEQKVPAKPAVRREHDFYPTGEPEAIRGLMKLDGDRIARAGTMVWEPSVGDGHMAREIEAHGFKVRGGDIVQRAWEGITCLGSFYDTTIAAAPSIITNPPYSEINARDGHARWLRHTLEMPGWRYLALLLSWDWPAAFSNGHAGLLDRHPFSYCYLMRWKLDFTGEGCPPQRNAWFVWDRDDPRSTTGPGAEPAFRWMNKPAASVSQAELDL